MTDSRPERADFRPERADFRPEGPRGDEKTDGRKNEQTKVPCPKTMFLKNKLKSR